MNNEPSYQNTPPPPPPSTGYTYYPPGSQGYAQPGQGYMPPPGYVPLPPPGYAQAAYPGVVYVPQIPAMPDPGKGLAITGFVLGIVSICLLCLALTPFFFIPLIVAVLGLIFSTVGRKSRTAHGLAIAGLVLSIIAVVLSCIGFFVYISILARASHIGY